MSENTKKWQMIAGGIIVAAAFAIMMPGVIDYVFRIGKVIAMVAIALAMAAGVVYLKREARAKRGSTRSTTVAAQKEPES